MRRLLFISIGCVLFLPQVGCRSARVERLSESFLSLTTIRLGESCHTIPTKHKLVRDQLVVHSDFALPEQHRLVDQLAAQRRVLSEKLGLEPTDEPIHVFLFDSDVAYYDFIGKRFPDFPARRALFVETDTQLTVYAHWGDHVAEDLRHEVAHGYLHASVSNLPLWLDEGLAEYFEVQREQQGLNRPHVELLTELLQSSTWQPDLVRLEQLRSAGEMTQQDYAESWAWVHFLLETSDERRQILTQYLAELRENGSAETLSHRLAKHLTRAELTLVEHVENLWQAAGG